MEAEGGEIRAVLSPQEAKARYDRAAKEILSLPYLCALILKKTMPERFRGSLRDIASSLRKSLAGYGTEISGGMKDQLTEIEKDGMSFDSLVLYICETEDPDVLLINVEVQNTYPGSAYSAGRIFFYVGTMLTAQKNDVSGFSGNEYGNVKPVCALWILPHMEYSCVIDCKTAAKMTYTDSEKNGGMNLLNALNGFIHIKVAAIGVDWEQSPDDAIQCLGHIFRDSVDPEKQVQYLEREGVPVTTQTRSSLDEYNEAQVVWLDPKMKHQYDAMKTERDEYESQLDWIRKNHPEAWQELLRHKTSKKG